MDAWDLYHKLADAWRTVAVVPSGASTKINFQKTPVFVEVNDKQVIVTNIKVENNQIILETTDVQSTV